MKLFNKEIEIVPKSKRSPCDGVLEFGVYRKNCFELHYCSWTFKANMEDFGFKHSIKWHPTYSCHTKSPKNAKRAVEAGLKRMTRSAYLKLKKYDLQ